MIYGSIEGLEKKISKLILGNDNQKNILLLQSYGIISTRMVEIPLIIQFIIEMEKMRNF